MTTASLAVLLIVLGGSAWATSSDAGDLTAGGQAIVGGTMTVRGGAFSVGGATFSVAGGSITLGGRLNASAEGIKWADNTVSVSAPSFSNLVSTRIPPGSATNTSFIGCNIAASTMTTTCGAGERVRFQGTLPVNNLYNNIIYLTGLLSGEFFPSYNATNPFLTLQTGGNSGYATFSVVSATQPAGEYKTCLGIWTGANTVYWTQNTGSSGSSITTECVR